MATIQDQIDSMTTVEQDLTDAFNRMQVQGGIQATDLSNVATARDDVQQLITTLQSEAATREQVVAWFLALPNSTPPDPAYDAVMQIYYQYNPPTTPGTGAAQ